MKRPQEYRRENEEAPHGGERGLLGSFWGNGVMGGNPSLPLERTPSIHLEQPLLALPFVHKF